ncbi:MAG: hypothetical protein ACI8TX_000591 [Hyphomicrobiaceae bacterium]|jgi:hypothetical protein
MAKLNEARVESISLAVAKALGEAKGVDVLDKGALVRHIADRLTQKSSADPELDRRVRQRIESLSREVPEGSAEWEIMYRQFSEELSRRR